jgi:hypothetical protein
MKNPGLRKPRPAMNQDESIGLEYLSRGGSPGEVLYTVCQEIQFILEGARFPSSPHISCTCASIAGISAKIHKMCGLACNPKGLELPVRWH